MLDYLLPVSQRGHVELLLENVLRQPHQPLACHLLIDEACRVLLEPCIARNKPLTDAFGRPALNILVLHVASFSILERLVDDGM